MKLSKDLDKLITQIKNSYNPNKIIIFGSTARFGPKEDRDVDLLIIKDTKKDHIRRSYEVRKCIDTKFPLDILVYTPSEFKKRFNLGDMFIREILETGKIVYEKRIF